ncbi:MAG: hypothetical protein JRJ83_08355 [Deltaproteobacteria bacterium]|nr:hypothetical protein [Deltaproteobacteria bacterium]
MVFRDIGAGSVRNTRNILEILNRAGIEPVVSDEENVVSRPHIAIRAKLSREIESLGKKLDREIF